MIDAQCKCRWGAVTAASVLMIAVGLPAQDQAPGRVASVPTFQTLFEFDSTNGALPAGLVQGPDGNFYGTTGRGGTNSAGTMFKVAQTGTMTTLYSFCAQTGCTDGSFPASALTLGPDGNFYGTTGNGGVNNNNGTVFKITSGVTLTTLHSFNGTDGAFPYSGLVQASDGNFYGTTDGGGADSFSGTVFKISAGGD